MIALSCIRFVFWGITVEYPTLFQFFSIPIESCKYSAGVISAAHHYTGMDAIQIGNSCQETVASVGAVISPICQISACRNIIDSLHSGTCASIEDGEVLITLQNATLIGRGTRFTIVGCGIPDHFTLSVDSSVRSLHDDLRTAVAIKIIHHELSVVRTCTDIVSHINTPEPFTRKPVAIEEDISSIAIMGIIMCVRGIPFQNNLIFSIPIDITNRSVIGYIGECLSRRGDPIRRTVQRNIDVSYGCLRRQCIVALDVSRFHAAYNGPHGVRGCFLSFIGIPVESSRSSRYFGYLLSVPIEVERCILGVGREVSPGNSYF